MPGPELKTYYAKDRKTWRNWLEKNHAKSPGVWLVYFKKASGKPRLSYNDAVEEALCFGWIDSTVKSMDDDRYMQRFTPRKPKSGWSGINKERIEKITAAGLMNDAGLVKIDAAKKDGSWTSLDKIYAPADQLLIPDELGKAFSRNKKAKINFDNFPVFARRQFLSWINSAKQPGTLKARIKQVVLMSAANKKPGIKGFKL